MLTPNSVEATARHAGNLGYQVFVVGDACWAVDKIDLRGKRWLADDVHALSLAHLHGEYASVVDAATTLRAAARAKARQRRAAGKPDVLVAVRAFEAEAQKALVYPGASTRTRLKPIRETPLSPMGFSARYERRRLSLCRAPRAPHSPVSARARTLTTDPVFGCGFNCVRSK